MIHTTDADKELYDTIRKALNNYELIMQSSVDPNGNYNLADALSPEWADTIKEGNEELDNLADYIAGCIFNDRKQYEINSERLRGGSPKLS